MRGARGPRTTLPPPQSSARKCPVLSGIPAVPREIVAWQRRGVCEGHTGASGLTIERKVLQQAYDLLSQKNTWIYGAWPATATMIPATGTLRDIAGAPQCTIRVPVSRRSVPSPHS
jgi:hypothetical protein